MNAHTPTAALPLTPLALANAALLRALQAQDFASKTELAERVGRDLSNLNKTLAKLADEGLVAPITATLTDAGANAVRLLDRLDGPDAPNPPPLGEGDREAVEGASPADAVPGYALLLWDQIEPDPLNPRKAFDDDAIAELADSIARDGLLENLVVRPRASVETVIPANGGAPAPEAEPGPFMDWITGPDGKPVRAYRLVAGERRHRAIRLLIADGRWPRAQPILCRLTDLDDAGHRRVALVENLQRKDLKPLEESRAIRELMDATGAGTAEIAAEIGFTQRWVQQRLQLLELPADRQKKLEDGQLSIEDARRWLGNRPKLLELEDAQWLLALEVFDHVVSDADDAGKVQTEAKTDPEFAALRMMFYGPSPDWDQGYETGFSYVSTSYVCREQLHLKFGAERIDSAEARELLLRNIQADLHRPPTGGHRYATPWLNGPFEISPERAAEIEATRQERQRQAEDRDAAGARARELAALTLESAQALAETCRDREPPPPLRPMMTELYRDAGMQLPVHVAANGDINGADDRTIIRTGYGAAPPPAIVARNLLIAVAINAAAGLATPDAPIPPPEGEVSAQPTEGASPETDDDFDDDVRLAE